METPFDWDRAVWDDACARAYIALSAAADSAGQRWITVHGKPIMVGDNPIGIHHIIGASHKFGLSPSAQASLVNAHHKGMLQTDTSLYHTIAAGPPPEGQAQEAHGFASGKGLSHGWKPEWHPGQGIMPTQNNGKKIFDPEESTSPTHAMPPKPYTPQPKKRVPLLGQSFKPGTPGSSRKMLNGIAITPLNKMAYREVKHADIYEPPMPKPRGKWNSAGVVLTEPDGRLWIRHPAGDFGGDQWTFAKGQIDRGLTAQQAALKEVQEENGLNASISDYLGDYEGTMSTTRYYIGQRTGGNPSQYEDNETDDVRLVTLDEAKQMMTGEREKQILKDFEAHLKRGDKGDEGEKKDAK